MNGTALEMAGYALLANNACGLLAAGSTRRRITMKPKVSDTELIAKLATKHPEKRPYVSPLLGGPSGNAVFYPDVGVGNGPDGELMYEDRD